jgi:hypothetical protein
LKLKIPEALDLSALETASSPTVPNRVATAS